MNELITAELFVVLQAERLRVGSCVACGVVCGLVMF